MGTTKDIREAVEAEFEFDPLVDDADIHVVNISGDVALNSTVPSYPRLGGLTRDAAGLRHARPAFLAAAIVAQAVSLGCYAQLYRRVLAALGARIRFRLAADVTLATFFVSHLTPFGSATGTVVNASTLETEGIAAATTGEAIALTSLTSTVALIVLFGTGFAATAGRHVSHQYLVTAGIVMFLVRPGPAFPLMPSVSRCCLSR